MSQIEEIKASVTIPQLWVKLNVPGDLKEKGMMLCPFHTEKSGSFSIYDNGKKCHCFGCGEGGDVLDFYRLIMGLPDDKNGLLQSINGIAQLIGLRLEGETARAALPRKPKDFKPGTFISAKKLADEMTKPSEKYLEWAKSKGIGNSTIHRMVNEGSIMFKNGNPVYVYNTGHKTRFDIHSSKSSRWTLGSPQGGMWRFAQIRKFSVKNIVIMEGESDTMLMLQELEGTAEAIGMPQASHIMTPTLAAIIGTGRNVILAMDMDKAGMIARQRTLDLLHEHATDCNAISLEWELEDGKDFCAMSKEKRANLIDNIACFCSVYKR